MKKILRGIIAFIILVVMSVMCVSLLCGCQSTDTKNSYFLNTEFQEGTYRCEYDSSNDKTKVIFATTLSNETIYNINSFSVTLRLYNDSTLVATNTYNWDYDVKHGEECVDKFNFYVAGEVDSIEYVSWTANYDTFWDTYKIWIIAAIAVSLVASLIMIIADKDLDEIGWLFYVGIPIMGVLFSVSWVPALIVLCGVIVFIVIVKIKEDF